MIPIACYEFYVWTSHTLDYKSHFQNSCLAAILDRSVSRISFRHSYMPNKYMYTALGFVAASIISLEE